MHHTDDVSFYADDHARAAPAMACSSSGSTSVAHYELSALPALYPNPQAVENFLKWLWPYDESLAFLPPQLPERGKPHLLNLAPRAEPTDAL